MYVDTHGLFDKMRLDLENYIFSTEAELPQFLLRVQFCVYFRTTKSCFYVNFIDRGKVSYKGPTDITDHAQIVLWYSPTLYITMNTQSTSIRCSKDD